MSNMATRLAKLKIDEVSGVDDPANLTPGWLVMKSKDELEAILKTAENMQGELGMLGTALAISEDALGAAPDEVKDAVAKLRAHIESEAKPEDVEKVSLAQKIVRLIGGKPEATTETEPTPAAKSESEPEAKGDSGELDVEAFAKALGEKLNEELEPIREVLSSVLDDVSKLKGRTAGSRALAGQEVETSATKARDNESLGDVFARVLKGEKVEIR